MIGLIEKGLAVFSSAIAYKMGGGGVTKYRDFGVPIIAWITMAFILGISAPLWVHLLSGFLMFAALTTYCDKIFWTDNFYCHGFLIASAYFPYAIVGAIGWWAFSIRVIALALMMGLWCKWFSSDWVEEWGRGSFIILTLLLFF